MIMREKESDEKIRQAEGKRYRGAGTR